MTDRTVVIGGGIAGLAAAFELADRRVAGEVRLLEASERLGGNIRTSREMGFTIEWGVNGFLDSVPETLRLVDRLGLTGELEPAADAAGRRYLYRGGALREIPLKPHRFLSSDLLSVAGRMRVLAEPFARRRPGGDETVFDFAARRIGREAAEILVDSMVSGVYAGDARRLSLAATFPRMAAMEAEHGSLLRALLARRRARGSGGGPAGPAGTLTSFRRGMESLVARLAERLAPEAVSLERPVDAVERIDRGYRITARTGEAWEAERVVVAAPARSAARFLAALDSVLAGRLAEIESAGLAVAALAFRAEDLASVPDGFGFLVPRGQGVRILGCLWDSSIFPGRAPEGSVLLRAMIGGARDPEAAGLDEEELLAIVRGDLRTTMGIDAAPRWTRLYRFPLGIPQYTPGHLQRLEGIDERLARFPGLALVGNSYRGVAVNNCVREAAALAEEWSRLPSDAPGEGGRFRLAGPDSVR